jgi:GTPase
VKAAGDDLHAAARLLFRDIAERTAGRSFCYPVAQAAAEWAGKFGEPMRVAVAGEIKQGKSTLVNALVAGPGRRHRPARNHVRADGTRVR